jgi:hypothetical protein
MSFKCFIKQINCSKIKSPAHSGQQSSWPVGKRKCANVKTFGITDWSVRNRQSHLSKNDIPKCQKNCVVFIKLSPKMGFSSHSVPN